VLDTSTLVSAALYTGSIPDQALSKALEDVLRKRRQRVFGRVGVRIDRTLHRAEAASIPELVAEVTA